MASKRKSFAAQIDQRAAQLAQEEPQEATGSAKPPPVGKDDGNAPQEAQEIGFQKYTVPIRTDQLKDIADFIARTQLDFDVELSRAVIIRHAINVVLADAQEDPERLLQHLAALEQAELEMNTDRKYSRSPGLSRYYPQ